MRTSLERELRRLEVRLHVELRRELDTRLAELTRYIDDEVEAITHRIDDVHARALRELTRQTQEGARR